MSDYVIEFCYRCEDEGFKLKEEIPIWFPDRRWEIPDGFRLLPHLSGWWCKQTENWSALCNACINLYRFERIFDLLREGEMNGSIRAS